MMFRAALLLALVGWWPGGLIAHEMTMAELQLRESARGEFLWTWAVTERPTAGELTVRWPDACRAEEAVLHCGAGGLRGTLAVEGIGRSFSIALVKVYWLDGRSSVYSLNAVQPSARLFGTADDQRGASEIARGYLGLGIEHILTGYDHLAFVLALLLLTGFNRRLLLTISAFTLAHSLTLAFSAFGWLALRPPPVEATIALSIMLVAGEALHERPTLTRRWPALVAFLFGLVHGLGFAGALAEFGLPQEHRALALLAFNVGVELGQLLVILAAFAIHRALARRWQLSAARVAVVYSIGSIAACWSIGRVATMLS